MASRIALKALRVSARPSRAAAVLPRSIPAASRSMATQPDPSERASEILDAAPSSPGLITKTGSVVLGTGLLAAAISQELYVVNEESLVLLGTFILFTGIARAVKEPYKEWAEGQIAKIKGILNGARAEHTQAVKERIDSVEQMKDVVSLTKSLFAVSKETAELESDAFVQQQKVALAAEVKNVLDSWVRYEQQVKESEQAELTRAVIDRVLAGVKDEKTQREILASAVAEVEQLVKSKAI